MKKIAIYNNKGGVGKSTCVVNLAYALAKMGSSTLVADCDSQQNAFRFFTGGEPSKFIDIYQSQIYDELNIKLTRYQELFVKDCSNSSEISPDYFNDKNYFHFLIFDMPPAMNEFTRDILNQCDFVFVPLDFSAFSLQGLTTVTDFIAGCDTNFGGCFAAKFEKKNAYDVQMDETIRNALGDKYLATKIPHSNVIKNSINFGQTAYEYMKWNSAVIALGDLAAEIVERAEANG